MSRWRISCGEKCPQTTHCDAWSQATAGIRMVPKAVIFFLFFASLSFAVLLSFLPPYLTSLWLGQKGFGSDQAQSVNKYQKSERPKDLCSRAYAVGGMRQWVDDRSSAANAPDHTPAGKVVAARSASGSSDLIGEAMSAIHLAQDMISHGKLEKASKLFQHALALSPSHPDILTEYGEFLEHHSKDIVLAEHMYCRALITNPEHSKALINRKRTQPLVEEIDQNQFNALDTKRELLMRIPENHPGIKRMMQESYFRHIYHTTAIEGNTFTLAQTRMLVENRLAIGGKSVMEHNEILGMDSAFTFVNNSLMNRLGHLEAQDIKNIHKRVLGYVDPIGAGEFRTTQVFVGDYEPPDAMDVPSLMDEFIEWINCEDTLSLHPIEAAALAHYKLVWIHPFYDGNGRTSRLLMNLILMQAGYPPIIIKVEEKHIYYQHLQTANNGDVRPFIRFIAHCTERALDEYLLAGLENARSLVSIQRQHDDGRTIIIGDENQTRP